MSHPFNLQRRGAEPGAKANIMLTGGLMDLLSPLVCEPFRLLLVVLLVLVLVLLLLLHSSYIAVLVYVAKGPSESRRHDGPLARVYGPLC